jgi:hypothetical protein
MAKAPAKSAKAPAKKTPAKPKAKAAVNVEKVSEAALAKLKALGIEHQLQADIEWCLGSYRSDKNPIGLLDMMSRSLSVFKDELKKKTKGVTAKLISDLEKVLSSK